MIDIKNKYGFKNKEVEKYIRGASINFAIFGLKRFTKDFESETNNNYFIENLKIMDNDKDNNNSKVIIENLEFTI